jgi:nucleotide-binding universal stress UspA family protein
MRSHGTRLERLLVATDGHSTSDAALAFAKLLAARDGSLVEVIAVFAPRVANPPVEWRASVSRGKRNRVRAGELEGRVERQVRGRIGAGWPILHRRGHPPWTIAEAARVTAADLIIMGHGSVGESELRRPGQHTTEQIACLSDVPVFAVDGALRGFPRLAVMVVDGGAASARAQRVAASLIAKDGNLLRVTERVPRNMLKLINSLGADLISVPISGDSPEVRSLMSGNVAEVLDHARCSVLITPSPLIPARVSAIPAARTGSPPTDDLGLASHPSLRPN